MFDKYGLDGAMKSLLTLPGVFFTYRTRTTVLTASLFGIGMIAVLHPTPVSAADLVTDDGRSFLNCQVLKADALGIYVRHSSGIARVLYDDFSEELLAALGPLPEVEEESDASAPAKVPANAKGRGAAAESAETIPNAGSASAFQLVFWQRVTYGVPAAALASGQGPCCTPRRHVLPQYYRFPCRQLAEADFLITSGLLPRPAGVFTRQLPLGANSSRWRAY